MVHTAKIISILCHRFLTDDYGLLSEVDGNRLDVMETGLEGVAGSMYAPSLVLFFN